MTVAELLEKPEHWTKGSDARDAHGDMCNYNDENAKCWCLLGAMYKVYKNKPRDYELARSKILALIAPATYIPFWQDDPSRTHAEVLELVRKAGI